MLAPFGAASGRACRWLMHMTYAMAKTLQAIRNLLNRDVRDLFKVHGRLVDAEFLAQVRTAIRAVAGQEAAEQAVAAVDSAWRGRVVEMDQVKELLKSRFGEIMG